MNSPKSVDAATSPNDVAGATPDATPSAPSPATPGNGAESIPAPVARQEHPDLVDVGSPTFEPPRKRGRGRPPGIHTKHRPGRTLNPDASQPSLASVVAHPVAAEAKLKRYRDTAEMTVNMVTGALEQFGGEHWKPGEGEDKSLKDATHAYFVAKDIPDIPPGWMLFLVVMAYATPRLNHEKTRAQIANIKAKILGRRKWPTPSSVE